MPKFRICFAGTPAFAAAHLSTLLDSQHHVVAVYTQPDRPSGRGKKLQSSPVKKMAAANSIPVFQPDSLRSTQQEQVLSRLEPDLMVVVAYGLILPKPILKIPKYGCINVHASLLPRWRGAAPIERALLAGDKETGVTIMQMDEGLDTGEILMAEPVSIAATDSRVDLEHKLGIAGRKSLIYTLDHLRELSTKAIKQDDSHSTYAAKLKNSDALIDWNASADAVNRQIRAGLGRAPAFTFLEDQRFRILQATPLTEHPSASPGTIVATTKESFSVACVESLLRVEIVQLPGKTPMGVRDVINSRPLLFEPGKLVSSEQTPVKSKHR